MFYAIVGIIGILVIMAIAVALFLLIRNGLIKVFGKVGGNIFAIAFGFVIFAFVLKLLLALSA